MRKPQRTITVERRLRINERIRAPQVRVIADDGEQIGVITVEEARQMAREREVDLVEVSPTAVPPVCKLMNFGKFMYQQKKKAQDAKRHQTKIEVKEVKFRPKIDEHDYNFKKNHVLRFLGQGDKVKATIMFRGREIVHVDYGRHILLRLMEDVKDTALLEMEPRQEGKTLSMILSPKKTVAQKTPKKPGARGPSNAEDEDKTSRNEAVQADGKRTDTPPEGVPPAHPDEEDNEAQAQPPG